MKKIKTGTKILIAEIVYACGIGLAIVLGGLLRLLLKASFFVSVLAAIIVYIAAHVTAHFIGRCPYCHMSLYLRGGCLYDYCPYCGEHF